VSSKSEDVHCIAVSPRAYRAIKATLPAGSVIYPPERNDRGQYLGDELFQQSEKKRSDGIKWKRLWLAAGGRWIAHHCTGETIADLDAMGL
jgi:hypothetical protein